LITVGVVFAVFTECRMPWRGSWLSYSNGVSGMVLNLEEDNIGCVILGPYTEIQEGKRS
jgi:F0F1-type ATP synthase alpha subunit